MNVFEDLIGELKDENLLEDTVIEVKKNSGQSIGTEAQDTEADLSSEFATLDFETNGEIPGDESEAISEKDFFRKRAMEDVSSLQMVEHILSGVEREHMKMPAAPYDDLAVKKALHRFVQIPIGDGDAHTEAEYDLLQATQGWHTALSNRDKNISVSNIRRFCENSRPALSSQALMALARFYRNSPFSENVRSKFEFVMTRLFARDSGLERRKLLFGREEMVGHISTLYSNWSSITYHAPEENQATIDLSVQRFDDLVKHFEGAESFDGLLNADVFNSIRQYKEECGELFFAAEITGAAINCNVRLGNKYVELIFKEKLVNGPATLEEKYGYSFDQVASSSTGKTLLLTELLKDRPEYAEFPEEEKPEFEQESFDISRSVAAPRLDEKSEKRSKVTGVNKWLVVATVLVALVSCAIYFGADKLAGSDVAVAVASEINFDGSGLTDHLQSMKMSSGTAYGVTKPSWDALPENQQKEFLQRVFEFAKTKGLTKVNLLNYKGRTVGFATKDRFDVYPPS